MDNALKLKVAPSLISSKNCISRATELGVIIDNIWDISKLRGLPDEQFNELVKLAGVDMRSFIPSTSEPVKLSRRERRAQERQAVKAASTYLPPDEYKWMYHTTRIYDVPVEEIQLERVIIPSPPITNEEAYARISGGNGFSELFRSSSVSTASEGTATPFSTGGLSL